MNDQLFISTVLVAGFLSFFAPCTFPLIPVYFGIITDGAKGKSLFKYKGFTINAGTIGRTLLFVGGLSTTFILLGFGAGALGGLISSRTFIMVSGFVVVLLGIHQMDLIKIPGLQKYKTLKLKSKSQGKWFSAYLLGLTFSFGWTPCVGPVLGAVLVLSAGGGQASYGAMMMAVYAFGLALPFLIMAVASDLLLSKFITIEKHLGTIKKVGGALIVVMGILLMTEKLTVITIWIERLLN